MTLEEAYENYEKHGYITVVKNGEIRVEKEERE